MPLVLSRQKDETIIIGDDIRVTVSEIRGDKVRLAITAPGSVGVHRLEVYEAIKRENRAAGNVAPESLTPAMQIVEVTLPPGALPPASSGPFAHAYAAAKWLAAYSSCGQTADTVHGDKQQYREALRNARGIARSKEDRDRLQAATLLLEQSHEALRQKRAVTSFAKKSHNTRKGYRHG